MRPVQAPAWAPRLPSLDWRCRLHIDAGGFAGAPSMRRAGFFDALPIGGRLPSPMITHSNIQSSLY